MTDHRKTAVYIRLSAEDDNVDGRAKKESDSVTSQRILLKSFVIDQLGVAESDILEYVDDGVSGTHFKRQGFQQLQDDMKSGEIGCVVVKDFSRFGRDYLEVGFYTEIQFPSKGVRFIAINNNVDSANPTDNDFTPFLNIMNEWYARDTSKKIRSAFQAKNLAGKHTSSSVPYGYLKSEQDKNQWVIDPVAAPIVQRIYRMTMEGKGPYQIAAILSAEHIEITAYYHQKLGIGLWQKREISDPYKWGSSTIVHILTNPCYLGNT